MPVPCPRCDRSLPEDFLLQTPISGPCPSCGAGLDIVIFPALARERGKIDTLQLTASEGEGCCYEHREKRASAICARCGRFLCQLCDVQVDSKSWCPQCLVPGKLSLLERRRTLYDSIALAFALLPWLLGYLGLLSAPVVIFLAVRHWKAPSSIVPRTKWRFILALCIVGLELASFAVVVGAMLIYAIPGRR